MPLHVSLLGAQSITDDATGAVRTRSSRTLALVALPGPPRRRAADRASASPGCSGRTPPTRRR